MAGQEDLAELLSGMSPALLEGQFVFCSMPEAGYGEYAQLKPIGSYLEREGLTLIVPRAAADLHRVAYTATFRCITLNVHSSLTAIGLTAAVSGVLAERGIAANMVAGFFHDHVFVPTEHAEAAMAALRELSSPTS